MRGFRSVLESGAVQLGCFMTYPCPGAVERIGPDWDWFWIDAQHGQIDYNDALALVRACDLVGRPALIRVPSHERGWIARALDMGAAGIIAPQVNTPAEAAAIVTAAKFPPLGDRSYGARRCVDLYGRAFSHTANSDTLVMVQLESPEALDQADLIAAVEGVDVLNFGPDDVYLRLGRPMDKPKNADELAANVRTLAAACRKHGKFSAVVGVGADLMGLCVELGVNMIAVASEVGLLAEASKQAAAQARAAVGGAAPPVGKGVGRQSPY